MSKAATVSVPTSLEEVDQLLARGRELQRTILAIDGERNAEISQLDADLAALKLQHDEQKATAAQVALEKAAPFQAELDHITATVHLFAKTNRYSILPKGKKSKRLKNAILSWKFNQPSVKLVKKIKEAVVVAWLLKKGEDMKEFLRPKYELNREAILEKRPDIPGVEIDEGREEFRIQFVSDMVGTEEKFDLIAFPA